jgi:hypothetical protein
MALRAFIVRPFGVKNNIDFDQVERELIDPALTAAGVEGRTTGEIVKQGNIRTDMFQRLLTADLVIADLSIHNANVFYELGIRHSLREKRTFMIKSAGEAYPFDLQTDRYFTYDQEDPKKSLRDLIKALKYTLASPDQDSPVFRSLPNMKAQDPAKFLAVPTGFNEEVEIAVRNKYLGDLELLASEAKGFDWGVEGLRVAGRAQFKLKAFHGARDTWEAVRGYNSLDLEANTLLGTIYQRLGDLTRSDLAVDRVLDRVDVIGMDRAEALSLRARNAKTNWRSAWQDLLPEKQREDALRSPFLQQSFEAYAGAFDEALNHFYSGLNALGMLKVQIELATVLPEVWTELFKSDEEAERELEKRQEQFRKLAAAVEISIDAAQGRLKRENKSDVWVDISEADLCCLTSDKPKRVATTYRKALAGVPAFPADAARTQLDLYQLLGVLAANVTEALKEFPASEPPRTKQERVLLFTGHMIDKPGRAEPRFPADKEDVARQAIKDAIEKERAIAPIAYGIAGGASGGDILFHDVCAELGIPTRLYLALPREEYIVASVQSAGPQWVESFNQLLNMHPETRILSETKDLPSWLVERGDDYNIWQRNSLWLLYNALAEQDQSVTLIALWNGKTGDGPGGTADLVGQAGQRGSKVVILDTTQLFGFGTPISSPLLHDSLQNSETITMGRHESVQGQKSEAPTVFISYSRKDTAWKDRLVRQLGVLERERDLEIWDDQRIAAGDAWRNEIEGAMKKATVAVLLISADFLISDFVRGKEIPRLLQLRAANGLRIIPLIVHPCAWQAVEWLAQIQCLPEGGRALSEGRKSKIDKDLADLALKVRNLLRGSSSPKVT